MKQFVLQLKFAQNVHTPFSTLMVVPPAINAFPANSILPVFPIMILVFLKGCMPFILTLFEKISEAPPPPPHHPNIAKLYTSDLGTHSNFLYSFVGLLSKKYGCHIHYILNATFNCCSVQKD